MKIELDYSLTEELRSLIWRRRETWGKEFHRSDAVYCPLKAYCRMTGIEARPREQVVERWIIGELAHMIIERAFKQTEVEVLFNGSSAHIDVLYIDSPLEIKTSTLSIMNSVQLPEAWLKQLLYGMVFVNKREGILLTLDVVNKVLLAWKVRVSKKELVAASKEFRQKKRAILEAVKTGNWKLLKPKLEECSSCPYNYEGGCPIVGGGIENEKRQYKRTIRAALQEAE